MSEARVYAEGALRWVAASASGGGWTTASAAATALVGYVQAGTQSTSGQTVVTIMNRGLPSHHKITEKAAPEVVFTFIEAVTANDPAIRVATAGGATVPAMHFELKVSTSEEGAGSADYYLWTHCALVDNQWTEQAEGNQKRQTWRALAMVGPTASGYIA